MCRILIALLMAATALASEPHSLDQIIDTLQHDDENPEFAFRYPDVYGDDWRNQWFGMTTETRILGVMIAFATSGFERYTTGDPDLVLVVWNAGADSLPVPGEELIRDTLEWDAIRDHVYDLSDEWTESPDQFVYVDLSVHDLVIESGHAVNVGYSAVRDSPDDSLAILSDDGYPETRWASEWYNGEFVRMSAAWRGVNFFIRVVVETTLGTEILDSRGVPSGTEIRAYPNPFNALTSLRVEVQSPGRYRLTLYDLLGRHVAGLHDGHLRSGTHLVSVPAGGLPSGTYLARLRSEGVDVTTRLILQR